MGTRGYVVVRFRGRYYARYNHYDSYYEGLGKDIINSIPADPEKYKEWLEMQRRFHAEREKEFEENVYQISKDFAGMTDDAWVSEHDYCEVPAAILRPEDAIFIEYIYIINLDREVLTMNYGVHFKTSSIPRDDNQWLDSIVRCKYQHQVTLSMERCSEEHMGTPAVDLPPAVRDIAGCTYKRVAPKTSLGTAPGASFVVRVLAQAIKEYEYQILRFGCEWEPTGFAFREFTHALVAIAANQARFRSFPTTDCDPQWCSYSCDGTHLLQAGKGYLAQDHPLVGDLGALSQFGFLFHRPGHAPGAAPAETMYWLETNVLVYPALVTDGAAVSRAAAWGVEQGHTHFQVVVISVFDVALAEVSVNGASGPGNNPDGKQPFVKATESIRLSPIKPEFCYSSHPRERPERQQEDHGGILREGENDLSAKNCIGSARHLEKYFPGLAALVHFLDVAAARRAAVYAVSPVPTSSASRLPQELLDRIIDVMDADTWRTCSTVSRRFRASCLRTYRVDDDIDLVRGPWLAKMPTGRSRTPTSRLLFDIKTRSTDASRSIVEAGRDMKIMHHNWTPLVGTGERTIAMPYVVVNFGLVSTNSPVLPDEEDDDSANELPERDDYDDDYDDDSGGDGDEEEEDETEESPGVTDASTE